MRSSFNGLYIGLSGLRTQQTALDITGHNIANANTPGYSRQRAVLKPGSAYTVPAFNRPLYAGQIGTGVQVAEVERIRDEFIERQLRAEQHTTGRWKQLEAGLEKLQMIFNEPSETGIRAAMDQFWQSLQTLSQTPDDESARAVVRQNAALLIDSFHHTAEQMSDYRIELNDELQVQIDKVNYLAQQIADLNQRIVAISATGDNPNDLLDQRDKLIADLSELTNIQVRENTRGAVTISITGSTLVDHTTVHYLRAVPDENGDQMLDVVWEGMDNVHPQFNDGSLKAVLELRDQVVPKYQAYLNELAETLAAEFNAVHRQGYGLDEYAEVTGISFFTIDPDDDRGAARTISLSADIESSVSAIAAALEPTIPPDPTGDPSSLETESLKPERGRGDNRNLLQLIELQHRTNVEFEITLGGFVDRKTGSFSQYYSSIIGELGVDTQRAIRIAENQEVLMEHLQNQKESVSGVSLDEEIANLVQFQHAYSAAARVITTVDETLEVIINRMGLVGR